MRTIRRCTLIALCLAALPAAASAAGPTGVYVGELYEGGHVHAETVFFGQSVGDISATYWYRHADQKSYGQLRACRWVARRTVQCTWADQAGEGSFRATFSSNWDSFAGAWGQQDVDEAQVWNGKRTEGSRQPRPMVADQRAIR